MITNFIQNKDGVVAILSAIMLPIILLMGVLLLESAQYYHHHQTLSFISYSSAQEGLIKVAQILKDKAESNYQNLCQVLEPPPICNSNYWRDFITDTEISQIVLHPHHQNLIQTIITDAITRQTDIDPDLKLNYPLGFDPGDHQLKLLITLEYKPKHYISSFFNPRSIKAEGLSFIALQ